MTIFFYRQYSIIPHWIDWICLWIRNNRATDPIGWIHFFADYNGDMNLLRHNSGKSGIFFSVSTCSGGTRTKYVHRKDSFHLEITWIKGFFHRYLKIMQTLKLQYNNDRELFGWIASHRLAFSHFQHTKYITIKERSADVDILTCPWLIGRYLSASTI